MIDFLEQVQWIFSGLGMPLIEKVFGKKSDNGITINIENLSIAELNIIAGREGQLKSHYDELVDYLKKGGVKKIIKNVGKDFSAPFIQFINDLEFSEHLEIEEIIEKSRKISELKFLEKEKLSSNKTVKSVSNFIQESIPNLKEKVFKTVAREFIKSQNEFLKDIDEQNLEEKNIGGIVWFLQTNNQFSKSKIVTPEILGFERVHHKDALVNLAMNGKIKIKKVKLVKGDNCNNHHVYMKLKNVTDKPLICRIDKGQIVENKEVDNVFQNLAIAKNHDEIYFGPHEVKKETFDAYCLNKTRKVPVGQLGNLAIYQVKDKNFSSGDELWNQLNEKNKDI